MEEETHRVRADEADKLARIGEILEGVELPDVEVRLPRELADAAVAAWDRDDLQDVAETPEQLRLRHRAGTLALIGLAVKEHGRPEDTAVVVPLNAGLIGIAVDACDSRPAD
jgi:hypothetical protein